MKYGDLVSIVVPIYNRAHMIERTVGCLLAQSYPNIEILLVDDCSTDDIDAAVSKLNQPTVHLIKQPKNAGASAARNAGVDAAKGDLIAFHDSDDICIFDKIERQVRLLETLDETYIGVYASVISYADTDETSHELAHANMLPGPDVSPLSGDMYRQTVSRNVMNLPTMLLRKSAFLAVGGQDVRLRNNNDWDLALRLTKIGKFKFLPEAHYLVASPVRKNTGTQNISRSLTYSVRSFSIITGKLRRAGETDPVMADHYATTGNMLMRLGRPKFARRYLRAALAVKPTHKRALVLLPLSFALPVFNWLRNARRGAKLDNKN